jgi:hypothetical protein
MYVFDENNLYAIAWPKATTGANGSILISADNDLDEVTEVAALGGAGLKSKWGTPDATRFLLGI